MPDSYKQARRRASVAKKTGRGLRITWCGKLFTDRRYNWCYQTEPQAECYDRNVIAPRGKVLGGSSSINGLIYIRGQAEDFNHWRQLGNAGWSYDDVLPYFRRAEDNERGADDFHGAGGQLGVSDVRDEHPLAEAHAP